MYRAAAIATVLVWAGILWLAAGRAAARPFDPTTQGAYDAALQWWGHTPTDCATISAELVPAASIEANRGEATMPTEAGTACVLLIAEGEPPCGLQDVMRHEVGHLLGLDHSDDPRSIMHAVSPDWACQILYWAREARRARAALRKIGRARVSATRGRNLTLYRHELREDQINLGRAREGAALPPPEVN